MLPILYLQNKSQWQFFFNHSSYECAFPSYTHSRVLKIHIFNVVLWFDFFDLLSAVVSLKCIWFRA